LQLIHALSAAAGSDDGVLMGGDTTASDFCDSWIEHPVVDDCSPRTALAVFLSLDHSTIAFASHVIHHDGAHSPAVLHTGNRGRHPVWYIGYSGAISAGI